MEKLPVSSIKENPNNPRSIKKDKLEKLKKSIQDFPRMLYLRPLVVDEDLVVLGGNMRLRAVKELGYLDVPVLKVQDLTEEQKKEFVIKDNVNYGDWSWDNISLDWDLGKVDDWGLDIPNWLDEDDEVGDNEIDYLKNYINAKVKELVLYLSPSQYEETLSKLEGVMEDKDLDSHTDAVLFLLSYYRGELNYEKDNL